MLGGDLILMFLILLVLILILLSVIGHMILKSDRDQPYCTQDVWSFSSV